MNNTIYVETIGIIDSYLPIKLSKDKTIFHYLNKKIGSHFIKFDKPSDYLYFYTNTPDGRIKKREKAAVLFGLDIFDYQSENDEYRGFKPEVKYILSGKVGKEFIQDSKIVFDGKNNLSRLLNNCTELIEVTAYRENNEGTYTRPPVESEINLEYFFRNGVLVGVDAASNIPKNVIGAVTRSKMYAKTLEDYRNIFFSLLKNYDEIISPDSLYKRKENKKRKKINGFEMFAIDTKISEKEIIDDIIDNLYPILINEYRQTCKASENKE